MRARIFVLFLLQIVLVGAAPLADARAEAEATYADLHLESESTACGVGHDHLLCTICRTIGMGAVPALPVGILPNRAPRVPCRTALSHALRAGAVEAACHPSRAPPRA